ncbi:NAD(P)-dependent alcohol dehydrogenase [Pelagicoccus sp. SDUM812005]|uniref:NAD(P)-dependent alcohol dehydrogenase n=1 Tax=Pelagicoccus sp. SDUM812005 TaxID=3041257 RepID=UPI00280D65D2|nr:NAD(P)-dependent alcohol dehydrogenase [Pelagicoccus sp. SDUM812005]MDQ8183693.1 NAD(P)-dependent alcohol dehydrogenase [Pelagicoccus sp. SDUM812005]
MKAVVCEKYGPAAKVVRIGERDRPTPKGNELLVAVKASSVTSADCRIRSLNVPTGFSLLMRMALGFARPRNPVLGVDFSGVVEAVGPKVEGFEVGDPVLGSTGIRMGCHAEFVRVPARSAIVRKPEGISYESAAAFPFGYLTALSFLRDQAKLRSGQSVLVYGASGAVGAASVQLASSMGATVTGVCSGRNSELVRSLGAANVVDYQTQDMSRFEGRYDVVFDTVGKLGFENGMNLTKRGGTFLLTVAGIPDYLKIGRSKFGSGRRVSAGMAGEKKADLEYLANLLSSGVLKPVIDRCFPIDDIVAAYEYSESGRKRGNVVLSIS